MGEVGELNEHMNLVQIFLPSLDLGGAPFEASYFKLVHEELLEEFGGLTAYPQAPATGFWSPDGADVEKDELVVFEVMVEAVDRSWWAEYRERLETRFAQDEVLIRVLPAEKL